MSSKPSLESTPEVIQEWLRECAPVMSRATCEMLLALWPIEFVPRLSPDGHDYVRRQTAAGTHMRDLETGLRYIALRWPFEKVRLYAELPSGEVFLFERTVSEAREFSATTPLPRVAKEVLQEYVPKEEPEAST